MKLVRGHHPTIWRFITALKREKSLNGLKIEQYIADQEPLVSKKKYRDCALRISRIVENYERTELIDYLCDLAHD